MVRLLANPSVNRTPGKLRLPVPFALRAPVAGYVERSASTAEGSQEEAGLFLIIQDHMAFLPATPGDVPLIAL